MAEILKPAPNAALVLADGTVFSGYGIGVQGSTAGEICFNTAMTGYQEILTDPSYTGQIITFTFPHIGNVGTNVEDIEADKPTVAGLILREAITEPSNFRAAHHLDRWLEMQSITGITGVDTRALTRHIRTKGAQNCAIVFSKSDKLDVSKAKKALAEAPDMNGLELAAHVTTQVNKPWSQQRWELGKGHAELRGDEKTLPHVVAIDYGVKMNILRNLASVGCRITLVPATASAEDVLALKPDGVFLSNGPGDPAATGEYAVPTIKKLVAAEVPLFGICLGHQMLGIALGARTEKMKQGHRGANHPVKDLETGKVEITSQNHGFAISDTNLPDHVLVTHRSLFDGTIQGIAVKGKHVFSVQGHPEASPGPHDSAYLFTRFVDMIKQHKNKKAA